jgi:putative membrane protein
VITRLARRLIATWLSNCAGLLVATALLPQFGYGRNLGTLLLAGAILGAVNFALRPVVVLVTLPAVILSLGGVLLLVNALMLWVTSRLVSGLVLGSFWSALAAALVIWVVNLLLARWTLSRRRSGRRRRRSSRG